MVCHSAKKRSTLGGWYSLGAPASIGNGGLRGRAAEAEEEKEEGRSYSTRTKEEEEEAFLRGKHRFERNQKRKKADEEPKILYDMH